MSESESYSSNNNHPGHELTDAKARPVAIFLIALSGLVFLSMLFVAWLMDFFQSPLERDRPTPAGLTDRQQIPPEPRLQAYPAADLERLRMREERELNSYEWIDEATGVMRIPIARAMEIVAKNGLPSRLEGPENEGE